MDSLWKNVKILLVEDNPVDVRLTREAFEENKLVVDLEVAKDGQEAMNFLQKAKSGTIHIDLILLDLNIPKISGKEILKIVKTDIDLMAIPVVILSSSSNEEDIQGAYLANANCYIIKPLNFDKFVEIIKSLSDFWFNIVKMPNDVKVSASSPG